MLTADATLEVRTYGATLLNCHLNELAYTVLVKHLERVNLKNLLLQINREEGSNVVT